MPSSTDYSQEPSCSFLEDETDFPLLNAKVEKRAVKGRRCGAERQQADIGRRYVSITKVIEDPQRVLSQKRKNRLMKTCADDMTVGVQYSMNRKNRWELEPSNILSNLENSDDVNVVLADSEILASHRWGTDEKCQIVHKMDKNGVVKTLRARGRGAKYTTLLKAGETLESEDDSESSEQPKANIVYQIQRQHKNDRVYFGRSEMRGLGKSYWRQIARRNKTVDMSELEVSEMENSVHLEDNETYKPSRDFKFSLGDFINASTAVPINIRRQSIESIKNIEEIDKDELPKEARPFGLINISSVTNADHVYERTILSTADWEAYNFCQQVDALSSDEKVVVKWLDPNHQRASIDTSKKLGSLDKPEMFIIVDRCRKGSIGVTLNTSIRALAPMNDNILKNILTHQKSHSVEDIVRILVKLVLGWKMRTDDIITPENADMKEYFYNTSRTPTLTNHAVVVSEFEMAEMLRSEADNSEDEPFERISDDEFSSEEDSQGFETKIVGTIKLKCATCEKPSTEDLFEMDDSWQCIDCLRHNILFQIKTKCLPIDAAFVTDADATPYDVLPAILPLPIFNFYTKIAALEILENSHDEINDLFECPSCSNVVKVERPHEYSSCCCSGCATMWCIDCKNEPHWPLTCSEFVEWSDKWSKQYPHGLPTDKLTRFPKRFLCDCRCTVNVEDQSLASIKCHFCCKIVEPSMITAPKLRYSFKKRREVPIANVMPKVVRPVQLIRKDIADFCVEARLQRYSKPKTKLAKAVRTYKNVPVGKVYDLRRTVLLLVEYGLAKLYLVKKGNQGLKSSVIQLLRMLDELIDDIEMLKPTVEDSVKQLDAAINKVLEQFKIIDLV